IASPPPIFFIHSAPARGKTRGEKFSPQKIFGRAQKTIRSDVSAAQRGGIQLVASVRSASAPPRNHIAAARARVQIASDFCCDLPATQENDSSRTSITPAFAGAHVLCSAIAVLMIEPIRRECG